MKATRCDRCGKFSEEDGTQHHTLNYHHKTPTPDPWPREPAMRYITITIHMKPVNYGDNNYEGLDLCEGCFKNTLREALTPYLKLLEGLPSSPGDPDA